MKKMTLTNVDQKEKTISMTVLAVICFFAIFYHTTTDTNVYADRYILSLFCNPKMDFSEQFRIEGKS